MSSAPSANFASSVRASVGVSPHELAKSSSSTPVKRSRAWFSSPKTTPAPTRREPRRERQVADERADQRRLARRRSRPTTASRSPQCSSRSTGPSVNDAALDDRAGELRDRARRRRRREVAARAARAATASRPRRAARDGSSPACTLPRSAFVARRSAPPVWRASLRSPPSRFACWRRSASRVEYRFVLVEVVRVRRARAARAPARARPRTPTTCPAYSCTLAASPPRSRRPA